MDHFVWAVNNVDKLSPAACREWAMKNYSCDRVVLMYEEFFQMLNDVKNGGGFYAEHPERDQLDWLKKSC
jgi:hypothetical protein